MKTESIAPQMPFVWPDPRVSSGAASYASGPPFENAVRSAITVFGVISAIDRRAINWMEGFLADQANSRLRVVFSIHPTCRTSAADLREVLRLAKRHGERAAFKLYPEKSLVDRSSNLLCLCSADGSLAISNGPTENLGYAPTSASQANMTMRVTAGAFEACRKWFDYLWSIAGPLGPEIAASMPRLVLPKGDSEASRLWDAFRTRCLNQSEMKQAQIRVEEDPESGELLLIDKNGELLASPTEAIGVPKLDRLAEGLVRVFESGRLVSIDKLSRIPPLEAPVKPEWFGVDSFRQTGMVRAQTSIKVAPFDASMLKTINRLRRVSGELLPRYSFALADGVRWIPQQAIPLFEAALTAADEDARALLNITVGESVEDFLDAQRDRIRADAQHMYEAYHPDSTIPESAVDNIIAELKARLDKTQAGKIVPRVAYSPIAFNPGQSSQWSSPWGQAFTLLKSIAELPRQVITGRFSWQGITTDACTLVKAMNVADDCIVRDGFASAHFFIDTRDKHTEWQLQAEAELKLIKQLEGAPGDARAKCSALWDLITTGRHGKATELIHGLRWK